MGLTAEEGVLCWTLRSCENKANILPRAGLLMATRGKDHLQLSLPLGFITKELPPSVDSTSFISCVFISFSIPFWKSLTLSCLGSYRSLTEFPPFSSLYSTDRPVLQHRCNHITPLPQAIDIYVMKSKFSTKQPWIWLKVIFSDVTLTNSFSSNSTFLALAQPDGSLLPKHTQCVRRPFSPPLLSTYLSQFIPA